MPLAAATRTVPVNCVPTACFTQLRCAVHPEYVPAASLTGTLPVSTTFKRCSISNNCNSPSALPALLTLWLTADWLKLIISPCPAKAFGQSDGNKDTELTQRVIHLFLIHIWINKSILFLKWKTQNVATEFQELL